jgi:hypothetical protein
LLANGILLKSNATVFDPQILQLSLILLGFGTSLRLECFRVLILLLLEVSETVIEFGDFLSLQRRMFVTFETVLDTEISYQGLSIFDGGLVPLP